MPFLLSPPVRPQCFHDTAPCNFITPPLDGTLTISEIFDWHNLHNPDHPLFTYSIGHDSRKLRKITYKDMVPASHRAGYYVANTCNIDLTEDYKTYPIVAILATADTITTFTTIVGMLRAGIIAFPMSPRFSPGVLAHLLSKNKVSSILISTEERIRLLAEEAVSEVNKHFPELEVRIHAMPKFSDIYTDCGARNGDSPFLHLPARNFDLFSTSFIVHSSCSTSEYPKAVRWRMRANLQNAMAPLFSKQPLCGKIFGCHGIELFHTLGLLFIFFSSSCGFTLATFPPQSPAVVQTPEAVFQGFRAVRPSWVLANPRFIQEWSKDKDKVRFLSTLQGVMYGGKLISRPIGDYLAGEGVRLMPSYGSTEAGQISAMVSECSEEGSWDYFEINPHCCAKFIPIGDGSYKLYLMATETQDLPCINAVVEGNDGYDTGDLLMPHPTKEGLWKVLGRADDQIMLATGEVINPVHLEDILCGHPYVSAAVIFGQARMRLGVLVELDPEHAFDLKDLSKLNRFRNAFWPQVERMNINISRSHISKEMIIVAEPSRPFVYTQKHSPKRPVILNHYQHDIDALYGSPALDPLYRGAKGNGISLSSVPRRLMDERVIPGRGISIAGH